MRFRRRENRRRAVMAARGEIPFDLLLTGAQIVDMVTGEVREAYLILVIGQLRRYPWSSFKQLLTHT